MRVSGWLLSSTFRLSAPNAAMKRVPPAEARNQVKSRIRMSSSAKGLPRREGAPPLEASASGAIFGAGFGSGVSTVSASSFSSGARRPVCQPVAVPIHLLVA